MRLIAILLASQILIGTAISFNIDLVGIAHNIDMGNLLAKEIDADEKKAYFLFNNRFERWDFNGESFRPEQSIPWTAITTGDQHRGIFTIGELRVVHYTRYHMIVYDQRLKNPAVISANAHEFTDPSNDVSLIPLYEYRKVYTLGGYTDRFVLQVYSPTLLRYKWAVAWISGSNTLNYRELYFLPQDGIVDIVPIRRGAGIAVIRNYRRVEAYSLLDGNNLWVRDINIGNPTRAAYVYPKKELVLLDNDQRLRIFDEVSGYQKIPPPIEWVNHTFRDFKIAPESDKIFATTNRRAMVIDADRWYRVGTFRNETADAPGKSLRYDQVSLNSPYFLALEDEVVKRNYRLYSVSATPEWEVCHINCEKSCVRGIQYCEQTEAYGMWSWMRCNDPYRRLWICRSPIWLRWLVLVGLLVLLVALILLCMMCCKGGSTREMHLREKYKGGAMNQHYSEEEQHIIEEERIVEKHVSSNTRVVEQERMVVEEKGFNPYKRR